MDFKDNLRKLRKERGISQDALSKNVGVKRSTIAGYEQGWLQPGHKTLIRLASYFEVSIDFLMGQLPSALNEIVKADDVDVYTYVQALLDNLDASTVTVKYKDMQLNEAQSEYVKKSLLHMLDCVELFKCS